MLTVETIRKIRLAAGDGKKSIRQIARDFNLSRNRVRKVLQSDKTRFEYHRGSSVEGVFRSDIRRSDSLEKSLSVILFTV